MKTFENADFINTAYDIGGASIEVMPYNPLRRYLLIQNRSVGDMFLSFGNKANIFDGIFIPGGGFYEPYVVPLSSVNLFSQMQTRAIVIEGLPPRR